MRNFPLFSYFSQFTDEEFKDFTIGDPYCGFQVGISIFCMWETYKPVTYVLFSPQDVTSKSVNSPQLSYSELRALAEELDNLEINIGNICVDHSDKQCVSLVVHQIQAQVGNGNTQHIGDSVAQNQGRKNSKNSQVWIQLFYLALWAQLAQVDQLALLAQF